MPSYFDKSFPLNKTENNISQPLFEGAEKKLSIRFFNNNSSVREDKKGLRNLSRGQIESVTGAANCTIISVKSNGIVDAYLLSESSLFISKNELVIKTCGTTTLLHAVPIIFSLAKSVGLVPLDLKFTRVSYLFPEQQIFPHNSFENEIAYLDNFFETFEGYSTHSNFTRQVSQHNTSSSSEWYAYIVCFKERYAGGKKQSILRRKNEKTSLRIMEKGFLKNNYIHNSTKTLEVCMFDLNPKIMQQFMHEKEPEKCGRDNPSTGVTYLSGINGLLVNTDCVDAFNFDPCGYSMNAISSCGGYTTIHITPEENASYVSFETNVQDAIDSEILLSIVRTFLPGRLTVSLVSSNHPSALHDERFSISWFGKLLNGLSSNYSKFSKPYIDTWYDGAAIVAGSSMVNKIYNHSIHFQHHRKNSTKCITNQTTQCQLFTSLPKPEKLFEDYFKDSLEDPIRLRYFTDTGDDQLMHLDSSIFKNSDIFEKNDFDEKHIGDTMNIFNIISDAGNDSSSIILLDLSKMSNNFMRTREKNPQYLHNCQAGHKMEFKFIVSACFDIQVLRLFSTFPEVNFEVSDLLEIETLYSVGVQRSRISLSAKPLMYKHVDLFSSVNSVTLNSSTNHHILRAMHEAHIYADLVFYSSPQITKFSSDLRYNFSALQDVCTSNRVPVRLMRPYDISKMLCSERNSTRKNIDNEIKENSNEVAGNEKYTQQKSKEKRKLTKTLYTNFNGISKPELGEDLKISSNIKIAKCINEEIGRTNDYQSESKLIPRMQSFDVKFCDISQPVLKGAITIILTVIGTRIRTNGVGTLEQDVFLNDGVYGVLASALMRSSPSNSGVHPADDNGIVRPRPLKPKYLKKDGEKQLTTLWGPTCDAADLVWQGNFDIVNVGDHIAFDGNGGMFAYGYSSRFNGFDNSMKRIYVTPCI